MSRPRDKRRRRRRMRRLYSFAAICHAARRALSPGLTAPSATPSAADTLRPPRRGSRLKTCGVSAGAALARGAGRGAGDELRGAEEGRRRIMKLDRCLLVVAMVVGAVAATGCKSSGDRSAPGSDDPDPASGASTQPGAQGPSDTPASDGDGMRRAHRHRGRHGGGRGDGRGDGQGDGQGDGRGDGRGQGRGQGRGEGRWHRQWGGGDRPDRGNDGPPDPGRSWGGGADQPDPRGDAPPVQPQGR